MADSPALHAAYTYEKPHAWSDNQGDVERVPSLDEMRDNIMLHWPPNAGAASGRLSWEGGDDTALPIGLPVGVSQSAAAPEYAPRPRAKPYSRNIIHRATRTGVAASQGLSSRTSS